eukprot:11171139-Lingulodinium_polyedra.AAC.1
MQRTTCLLHSSSRRANEPNVASPSPSRPQHIPRSMLHVRTGHIPANHVDLAREECIKHVTTAGQILGSNN